MLFVLSALSSHPTPHKQGSTQYVTVELPAPATVCEVRVRFQGGFVGSECSLLAGESDRELKEVGRFYPEDINSLQVS